MAKRRGIMAASQIPYKDRLLMQKHQTIAAHRDEAARIALQVGCVALNDTEGLGYTRLARFAKHLQELIAEYYDGPEVGEVHLSRRLEQLGFRVVDGHMYGAENAQTGEIAPVKMLEAQDGK